MNHSFLIPRSLRRGFTLIELLCVMAIIGLLTSLLMPAMTEVRQRADSMACASNLRQIGLANQLYLNDHSFVFPEIESDPNQPIYTPPGQTMVQAFGSYGITSKLVQCPADLKTPGGGTYGVQGSSYIWKPTLDNENSHNAVIFGRRGQFTVPLAKVRIVFDENSIHFGHRNGLYGDGHVVSYSF